jgi:hypothetical protein
MLSLHNDDPCQWLLIPTYLRYLPLLRDTTIHNHSSHFCCFSLVMYVVVTSYRLILRYSKYYQLDIWTRILFSILWRLQLAMLAYRCNCNPVFMLHQPLHVLGPGFFRLDWTRFYHAIYSTCDQNWAQALPQPIMISSNAHIIIAWNKRHRRILYALMICEVWSGHRALS